MLSKLQDKCSEYKIKKLTEQDCLDIFNLYNSNPDYFNIVEARPPNLKDCMNDLMECPPNFLQEKKFFIGFYKEEQLFAVVDYLLGYPDEDIFYIGLYMIEGRNRAKGYGRTLVSDIIDVVINEGYKKLRLGVVSENLNAVNFWTRNGLKEIKRVPRKRDNGTVAEVILMEKELISE